MLSMNAVSGKILDLKNRRNIVMSSVMCVMSADGMYREVRIYSFRTTYISVLGRGLI